MKVFIGTINITDAPRLLQQGFRELGFEADIALLKKDHPFYQSTESAFDVDNLYADAKTFVHRDGSLQTKPNKAFVQLANKYNIFIFIAGYSLLPRLTDLNILCRMGKTIVCYQSGSELRHEITSVAFWSAYGHIFPSGAFISDPRYYYNPKAGPKETKRIAQLLLSTSPFTHSLINKMYNTRMAEMYATTICTHPSIISCGIRPHMSIQLPFDTSLCKFKPPMNDVPLVVHAPSKRSFKGSNLIINTLRDLKDEGIPFRFCFLENLENHDILKTLSQADVLIDQVVCGAFGRLALEGLASGCAVVSGNSSCVPWPPDRPAVSVTPINLKNCLREVLTNKKLRIDLANQGYEYLQKGYHEPTNAAQSILNALEREQNKQFDYYPTAFTEIATKKPYEFIPAFLQNMTKEILTQHGTSPMTNLSRLASEGFIPAEFAHSEVPRWNMDALRNIGPWNWCAKHIPMPSFDTGHTFKNYFLEEKC